MNAKLLIFGDISKEYFKVVDTEDAVVAYLTALAGGEWTHFHLVFLGIGSSTIDFLSLSVWISFC